MLTIGIAGGSGSGKTTVVKKLIERLPKDAVSLILQDSYYKDNSHLTEEEKKQVNYDHPSSIEFDLLLQHFDLLMEGKNIDMPLYSYVTHTRQKETKLIKPKKVVILEGILIYTHPEIRKRLDIKVFVDADADDRLMRRIKRDTIERGRALNDILTHYEDSVKPMHLQFIEPSKRYADIIVPQGGENEIAIDILRSKMESYL